MPRAIPQPKAETFNFRLDPALKTAFTQATEAEDKPAAQVLREFMRAYVDRRQRRVFEAEAERQSRAIAARAQDPESDEAQSMRELDALLEADDFHDEWKA
ncbi:hypothetical protein Q8W71_31720 [Methylobacterium sp. NEAU 140]|uniref:hypothetical protein n=1 Tax=Methylobacterium sp. NEAU 140 TaxID=3064945 RepID=UPI002735C6BA|nr:hypothetical protein [Methylobacterium sp. NEAU 140]MDP4027149.1 hypothetical protein [Methylobacterium sp. NEAU 140]